MDDLRHFVITAQYINDRLITNPDQLPPKSREMYDYDVKKMALAERLDEFEGLCKGGDTLGILAYMENNGASPRFLSRGLEGAIAGDALANMKTLFDAGAVINEDVSFEAITGKCSLPVYQLLCSNGWDINSSTKRGHTALFKNLHNEDLVQWFLHNGALLDYDSGPSGTSTLKSSDYLNEAGYKASITTFDLLVAKGADKANSVPLHYASRQCPRPIAKTLKMMAHLIAIGYDVNGSDATLGRSRRLGTPLRYALDFNTIPSIKCLLDHGADPDTCIDGFCSPYDFARALLARRFFMNPEKSRKIIMLLKNSRREDEATLVGRK